MESHTAEAQQRMRALQAMHGVCTASPRWAKHSGFGGVFGEQLPAYLARSSPGDLVIFSGSMYQ
eukprot:COSAG05_NODE_4994_length_1299_cov_83.797500_1_plen_64_part_00